MSESTQPVAGDQKMSSLEQDIARAVKAQKRIIEAVRKPAPKGVKVGATYSDPRQALIERVCPDKKERAKWTFFFDWPGDKNERYKRRLSEGFEPVIEDGEIVYQGADIMYRRPKEISQAHIRQADELSQARMRSQDDELEEGRKEGLVDEEDVSVQKVSETQ